MRVRSFALVGVIGMFTSLLIVTFLLPHLPQGSTNPMHRGAAQQPPSPPADFRSTELRQVLDNWRRHFQAGGSTVPPPQR